MNKNISTKNFWHQLPLL